MEWSATSVTPGMCVTVVFFNQLLDQFKVAIAAWEQDINNNQTVIPLSVTQLDSV